MTVHVAASLFGVGLLTILLLSFIVAFEKANKAERIYLAVANSGLILFIFLLAIFHQALQGVRYFIFLEIYLISLNILSMSSVNNPRFNLSFPQMRPALKIIGIIFGSWFLVDAVLFYRITEGRSESYRNFLVSDFNYLKDRKGIAWDVGMVGFFTEGFILDPNGLVNGREIASISSQERMKLFSEERVEFAFVNEGQKRMLNQYIDTKNWLSVASFDFPNIRPGRDTHILLVEPSIIPGS